MFVVLKLYNTNIRLVCYIGERLLCRWILFFPLFSLQSVITSSSSTVSAVSRKTPGVKVRQPLSGSYLIHTSSCLISSLLFMGAGPSVAQGMEYLIREKLQHPRGNFNTVCVLLLLFSQDTN